MTVFKFNAVATDKGTPPLNSTAEVRISVVTSGSHPPQLVNVFPMQPIIREDVPEGTEVMTVCVK